MFKFYFMAFLAVILTATSQALLKSGVGRAAGRSLVWIYANIYTVIAYSLFGIATLLNLYAYRILPLKVSAVIQPLTYILVGAYSHFILKERLNKRQYLGVVFIIIGVFVYNISPR